MRRQHAEFCAFRLIRDVKPALSRDKKLGFTAGPMEEISNARKLLDTISNPIVITAMSDSLTIVRRCSLRLMQLEHLPPITSSWRFQ